MTENRKQSLSEPSQAEPAEGAGIDRRTFIKRAGAAGVAFAAAATAGSVAPTALGRALNRRSKPLVPRHRIGIGTEVYAFSLQPPADVYTKLDEIRQIGYRAVELIEFNGFPGGISRAREVRRLLQKAGLRGVGNFHLTYATPNNIRNALEMLTAEDKAAGMIDFGMVAAEHDPSWQNEAKYRELAQDFNTWGEITRKAGLRFYVHNEDWVHDRDPTTGKHLYDIWIEETDPDLVFFNLDTFQLAYRGFDPVEYVERLEADDRITHFHMKDWSGVGPGPGVDRSAQTRDLGEGVIDFRRIMKAIRKPQKYWYIVEREASPDPTVSAQTSYNYLANLTG